MFVRTTESIWQSRIRVVSWRTSNDFEGMLIDIDAYDWAILEAPIATPAVAGGEERGGGAGAYYTLTSFLYCVICVAISFVNLSMSTKTKYIANTGGLGLNDLE